MLKHSTINRGLMFEWVRDCIDEGVAAPTDLQIMERFQFDAPEKARTLLADLADRGLISITGVGDSRVISLGKRPTPRPDTPRPLPSVRKPVADRPSGSGNADKIREILQRGKDAVTDTVLADTAAAPVPAEVPAEEVPVVAPAADPVPPAAAPRRRVEVLPPSMANRRQVNISLTHDSFAEMERRAVAAEKMPGAYARDVVMAHLGADPAIVEVSFAPGRKPRVRAAIAAAAAREWTDLYLFLTDLLDRGFAAYEQDRLAVQA